MLGLVEVGTETENNNGKDKHLAPHELEDARITRDGRLRK
jgi:hypothetical protein